MAGLYPAQAVVITQRHQAQLSATELTTQVPKPVPPWKGGAPTALAILLRVQRWYRRYTASCSCCGLSEPLVGGAQVIPAGLLLALQGQTDPDGVDATARKRVELLAAGRAPH